MKTLLVVLLVLAGNLVAGDDDFVVIRGAMAAAMKQHIQARGAGGAFTMAIEADGRAVEPELQQQILKGLGKLAGQFVPLSRASYDDSAYHFNGPDGKAIGLIRVFSIGYVSKDTLEIGITERGGPLDQAAGIYQVRYRAGKFEVKTTKTFDPK